MANAIFESLICYVFYTRDACFILMSEILQIVECTLRLWAPKQPELNLVTDADVETPDIFLEFL